MAISKLCICEKKRFMMKKFVIQHWIDDNDICPYCHSPEISDMREMLDDKVKGATELFYCLNCEGIFGYGT